VITPLGDNRIGASGLILDPTGRIVIAGATSDKSFLARYLAG